MDTRAFVTVEREFGHAHRPCFVLRERHVGRESAVVGVHVVEPPRRVEREVRAPQPSGDEEWLCLGLRLLQLRDRLGGEVVVVERAVLLVGGAHLVEQRIALLAAAVVAVRVEVDVPARRVVVRGEVRVVHLPTSCRVVPILLEELRERGPVFPDFAEVLDEVIHLRGLRRAARQEAVARRRAVRELHVRVAEGERTLGELVQVRRDEAALAVRAAQLRSEVINYEEEHRLLSSRERHRWRCESRGGSEQQADEQRRGAAHRKMNLSQERIGSR